MKKKPTIVYVIDNLGRGGAETLLVGILPAMANEYHIVLVTLTNVCDFSKEELQTCERYSLGFSGKLSFIPSVFRLRKILKEHKPVLIHAHLTLSSQIARLANAGNVPFAYSLHSILSTNIFDHSWLFKNLEKLLFRKKNFIIAVSSAALNDYEEHIGKPNNSYLISNYVSDSFNTDDLIYTAPAAKEKIKLVAIGNIKAVKNYEYLLQAFTKLDITKVCLDIYGKGDKVYIQSLQQFIDKHGLPVKFKGSTPSVHAILNEYHFFVMSSKNEGFGIAAIEAMAKGLPLILSDIPVFRDITFNNAIFFDLADVASFEKIIRGIQNHEHNLKELSVNGRMIVKANYTKERYVQKLLSAYQDILVNC